MSIRSSRLVHASIAGALTLSLMGCGNPLVGDWSRPDMRGAPTTITLHLGSDSTATITAVGYLTCSGTESYTGLTWSATGSTLTFPTTYACSGSVTCNGGAGAAMSNCPDGWLSREKGDCPYTLSGDGNTLVIGPCSGDPGSAVLTYTRAAAH